MHGRGTQDPSRGTGCWFVGKEGIVIIMVVIAVVALVGVIFIAANISKSSRRAVVGSSCNSSRRSCSSSRICSSSSRSRGNQSDSNSIIISKLNHFLSPC